MIEEEKRMEIKYSKRIWKRRKNRRGEIFERNKKRGGVER